MPEEGQAASRGLASALAFPLCALAGVVFLPAIPGLGLLLVAAQFPVVLRKNFLHSLWVMAVSLCGLVPLATRHAAAPVLLPLYGILIVFSGMGVIFLIRSEKARERKYRELFLDRKKEYESIEGQENTLSKANQKIDAQLAVHTRMYEGIRRMLEEKLSMQDFAALAAGFLQRVGGIQNYLIFIPHPTDKEKLRIDRAVGSDLAMLRGRSVSLKPGTVMDLLWNSRHGRLYTAGDMDLAFAGLVVPASFNALLTDSFNLGGRRSMVLVCSEKKDGLDQQDKQRVRTLLDNLSLAWKKTSLYTEVERLSRVDGLTGLTSRRRFDTVLEREMERAQRYGLSFGLAMADLDHFKKVNDTYGHLAGDEVLRQIGQLFLKSVSRPHIAARIGGEEIACLFFQESEEAVVGILEKLRKSIDQYSMKTGRVLENGDPEEIHMTASFGVSFYPRDAKGADKLMQAADKALYKAKSSGRNRLVITESNEHSIAHDTELAEEA